LQSSRLHKAVQADSSRETNRSVFSQRSDYLEPDWREIKHRARFEKMPGDNTAFGITWNIPRAEQR
jgi:hypothetical protein